MHYYSRSICSGGNRGEETRLITGHTSNELPLSCLTVSLLKVHKRPLKKEIIETRLDTELSIGKSQKTGKRQGQEKEKGRKKSGVWSLNLVTD